MDGKDGTDSKGDDTADKSPDERSADDCSSDVQAPHVDSLPTLHTHPGCAAQPMAASTASNGKAEPGAAAQPQTLKRRAQRLGRSAGRIWSELPTACKATLIVAVINFVLSVTYAIGAVALTTADEELHITLIILISAVFVVFSVADAIIYENTLELATSVVIDTLVLARIIFFAFEGSSHAAFKIAWCTMMLVVQTIYMVVALLAYREFGWRLYSKLGVDFREKGAADKMRMAIMRNSYATLLKVTGMLLVVLCALGIDVSVEKRGGDVLVQLMVVSLVGLALGGAAIALAVVLVLVRRERPAPPPLLLAFHILMPLSVGQSVATIAMYNVEANDAANASISLHVAAVTYFVFGIAVWVSTQLLYRKQERDRKNGAASVTLSAGGQSSVVAAGDPLLAPMQAGAWIGKPTPASPRKVRFFQLSYDGSTLRWGWNKFVRLYYIEDLTCDDLHLSITLAFPFDAELMLKFKDPATYHAWRRGLAHLLLMLMAPDARAPHEALEDGGGGSGRRPGGRVLLGQTTSRQLLGVPSRATMALVTGSAASAAAPSAPGDAPLSGGRGSLRGKRMLEQLGVRVQEMGRLFRSASLGKPRSSGPSWSQGAEATGSEAGAAAWDEEAGSSSGGRRTASGSLRTPRRSAAAPPSSEAARLRREADRSEQLEKRRRMAAYLRSLAAAAQPAAAERRPGGRPPPMAAAVMAAAPGKGAIPVAARLSTVESGDVRVSAGGVLTADVGVQTDESELLMAAGLGTPRSLRKRGSGLSGLADAPPSARRLQRLREEQVEAAVPPVPPALDACDAGVAAQYAAAMAVAAGAAGLGAAGREPSPAAASDRQQQQQDQQQQASADADADLAAQYAAAMAASGGSGVMQPPTPAQQQQQQQAPEGDADVAAQYMAAMAAAAAGGGGAAAPAAASAGFAAASADGTAEADLAAQYLAALQAAAAGGGAPAAAPFPPASSLAAPVRGGGLEGWAQGGATLRGLPPRRSLSITSPGAAASPLEQLAWQQQAAASARLAASLTPGSSAPSMGLGPAGGGGLWQLAAAVDVIDYEELSFGKLLGAGAEGAVYAAWFLESPVAVKKFERAADSLHEVGMYLQLGSHDNVVALRGLCQHEGSMYLVLEYCPRGTLDVMLHHSARGRWDPAKLLPLVRSIARGMHYLHSRSILHRDLKPANIFVGHGQMMKIGDFGMARIASTPVDGPPTLRRLTPGTVGTVQYCAPELVNEDLRPRGVEDMEWALKLDVWSFGVTLWEILERRRPFEGLSQNAVQAQWMADPYAARLPPVRLPDGGSLTVKRIYRGLSDLIEDCTRLDPYARPSSRDILLRLKSLAAFAERKDTAQEAL